jgi:hypothetical protein
MIRISGVSANESAQRRVARAIVRAIGAGGVCTKEMKCPQLGGDNCAECAAANHIKFEGGNASDT